MQRGTPFPFDANAPGHHSLEPYGRTNLYVFGHYLVSRLPSSCPSSGEVEECPSLGNEGTARQVCNGVRAFNQRHACPWPTWVHAPFSSFLQLQSSRPLCIGWASLTGERHTTSGAEAAGPCLLQRGTAGTHSIPFLPLLAPLNHRPTAVASPSWPGQAVWAGMGNLVLPGAAWVSTKSGSAPKA